MLTPGQAGNCSVAAQLLGHLRENTIVLAGGGGVARRGAGLFNLRKSTRRPHLHGEADVP